jgi:hypothetical protein
LTSSSPPCRRSKYLCASGAGEPAGIRAALYAYNPSPTDVEQVLAIAASYTSPLE